MISIRPASADDADRLFAWRNDATTRAASINTDIVTMDEHRGWLDRVLADDRRLLYLACDDDGSAVGMCRFDLDDDGIGAEVSINLDPARRGRGLAGPVLRAAIATVATSHPTIVSLSATIRSDNDASRRLFEAAGFTEVSPVMAPIRNYRLSLAVVPS